MLRFLELNEDKSPKTKFDINYPSMDNLANAGLILNDNVVFVDFDGDNGEKEKSIINYVFSNYPTLKITTERGVHLYYSKPKGLSIKAKADVITVGGFQCDYKTGEHAYGTVKRFGKERERNRDLTLSELPPLPEILYPLPVKDNLSNMNEGDGRNDGIFRHLCCVRKFYPNIDVEKIGDFINNNIFNVPLEYKEYINTINSVLNREITPIQENKPLEVMSALELKNSKLEPINFIVEGMLPQGLSIICSPPKYGKSWLMLDLCLSVSSGSDFLGRKTNICNCLYLALEDSKNRLKDRMLKILSGKEPSPNFDFSIKCGSIGTNLMEQLKNYIKEKPNTKLIVIDTLQKIRNSSGKSDNAYSSDYKDMSILKSFADENKLCILLVHHLRKLGDTGDVFSRISGTNAIMGACDTIFVLSREKRTDAQTILSMTGRDVEENEYVLIFNNYKWNIIGDVETQKIIEETNNYKNNPIVKTINRLVEENGGSYEGTASEIKDKCIEFYGEHKDTSVVVFSKEIRCLAKSLNFIDGIIYEPPPENGKGGKRPHKFIKGIDFSKNEVATDTTVY